MMNTRAKSTILAVAMIASSVQCNPLDSIFTYISENPGKCAAFTGVFMALKVRLDTKPRGEYNFAIWQQDAKDLLSSYNLFDPAARARILALFDKYVIGSKFKKVDTTRRTKEADGSVFTVTGCKIAQRSGGLMGLIDGYVLQQLKSAQDYIMPAAFIYVILRNPEGFVAKQVATNCNPVNEVKVDK